MPNPVRAAWPDLPLAGRLCVFETAELLSLEEDPGSMVTGPARA